MARHRLYIDVDYPTLRKLILWAKSRGEQKNTWGRIVLALECDKNEPLVKSWFEAEAKRIGMDADDLEKAVLEAENFDFKKYKEDLTGK